MLTAQYIKEFGQYSGYCKLNEGYIYFVGEKKFVWNGDGITRLIK